MARTREPAPPATLPFVICAPRTRDGSLSVPWVDGEEEKEARLPRDSRHDRTWIGWARAACVLTECRCRAHRMPEVGRSLPRARALSMAEATESPVSKLSRSANTSPRT